METQQVEKTKKGKAVVAAAAPSVPSTEVASMDWGEAPIEASDILVPKILCGQGLTPAVVEQKVNQGDLFDSITTQVIGGKGKPVEVILIHNFKTWIISDRKPGGSKPEFVEQVPDIGQKWEREESLPGNITRYRVLAANWYCLLVDQVKAGAVFPYLVSFRSTSYMAHKKIASIQAKLKTMKPPRFIAYKTVLISSALKKNDKGTFFIFDVAEGRDTTPEELAVAHQWNSVVRVAGAVKVDDSDLRASDVDHGEGVEVEEGDFKV